MTLAMLVLAASPALAGLGADCGKAYKPEYETLWGVTYADWEDGCRQGNDDKDLLRWLLKNSVEVCARRYQKAVDAGKVHPTTIRGYCAQGPAGRARLSALTGIPEREEPPKPPEPPPAPAPTSAGLPDKDFGLGPLVSALEEAKAWQPDACLAKLKYLWRARPISKYGNEKPDSLGYFFYSRKRWKESFVKWADQPGETQPKQTRNACITGVEVDLPGAIERAKKAGLPVSAGEQLEALLLHVDATAAPPISAVKGKTVWDITVNPSSGRRRAAMIDAISGKVLYKGQPLKLPDVATEPPR